MRLIHSTTFITLKKHTDKRRKMKPLPVSMLAFESAILNADKPVLVVFGAMWDRNSRMLFGLMDEYG